MYFSIPDIGDLRLDRILFADSFPILFTCVDVHNHLYLCLDCVTEPGYKKWLISPVSSNTIIKMLQDEITIRESFSSKGDKYTLIYDIKRRKWSCITNDKNDWNMENSVCLPIAGEYMEAEDDEYKEDIEYYRR